MSDSFFKKLRSKDGLPQSKVSIIRGKAKSTQDNLAIAYAGTDYVNTRYWATMFVENPNYGAPEMFSEINLKKDLSKKHPDCSLLLQECSPASSFISNEKFFIVPRCINTVIDISLPLAEMCRKSRSGFDRIRRWINAQNLSYETTHSEEAQKEFYYNMYLPFIRSRYADSSLILEFRGIFADTVPSEVFLIKKTDTFVAGAVIHYCENRPTLGFLGVKDGYIDDLKRWNTGAAYYFVISEFQKRAIKKLFIGGSPPFLSNGLLFFKMKLLAQIDTQEPWQSAGCISIDVLKYNDTIRDFLENNPFVYVKADGNIAAAVWKFSGSSKATAVLESQINQAFRLGLDECHVFARCSILGIEKRFARFPGKTIVFHRVGGWFNSGF